MNSTIKGNITQFVLIVFSVVLGLYLSERIEDRKTRQESKQLLTTIESEVKDNIRLLKKWSPYHLEVYKNLDSLSNNEEFIQEFVNDKTILFSKLFTRGTFMGRLPASDAWDIAKSHPRIVNIDYDKLVKLSRIYNQQEVSFEPGMEMIELFKSKHVNTKKDAKSNLKLMSNCMRELVALEEQLMYYYNKAEETLDLREDSKMEK